MRRDAAFVAAILLLVVAVEGQRRVCRPGSVFRDRCNICRCTADGAEMECRRTQCPRKYRLPFAILRATQTSEEMVCEPGTVFGKCGECFCLQNGDYICHLLECVIP